jgi:hypothetical protein
VLRRAIRAALNTFLIFPPAWMTFKQIRRLHVRSAPPGGEAVEAGGDEADELCREVARAVRELPEDLKTPLVGNVLGGKTFRELSSETGVPMGLCPLWLTPSTLSDPRPSVVEASARGPFHIAADAGLVWAELAACGTLRMAPIGRSNAVCDLLSTYSLGTVWRGSANANVRISGD